MRYFMQGKIGVFGIVLCFLVCGGCSTKKNTSTTRAFHNLTAYYNIYFNGQESYEEGLERYAEQYQDDYSQLLPVLIYGEESLHQSIKPQMERTVEKASKAIRMHSITAKPEARKGKLSEEEQAFYNQSEYNKYVDDSYLLIAKALFYQLDYVAAAKTFEYIISEYSDSTVIVDAKIWLARTYLQREDRKSTEKLLQQIQDLENLSKKQQLAFRLTRAFYYQQQGEIAQSKTELETILALQPKRKVARRVNYILGQMALLAEDNRAAAKYFESVLKLRPSYYMEFNTNLQLARINAGANSKEMIGKLRKMLKDEKNRDYWDQIYFAIGQIYLKQGEKALAIEDFKMAAYYSKNNANQKGLAYLALADLYFEDLVYRTAQAYYDSAVTSLERDYPGYVELYAKNENLTALVENLIQVEEQDSLLRIAALPEPERKAVVNKLIADLKKAEQEEKLRTQSSGGHYSTMQNARSRNQTTEEGKWYFYNPNAKSFGEPEFKRRWGERTLEDNWRRRDKQVLAFSGELTEEQAAAKLEAELKEEEKYSPETYLKRLPLSDSAKIQANFLIREGLYNAANVYYSQLQDNEKAIETYTDLLQRYQRGAYVLPAHYQLYSIYTEQGERTQANRHKEIILTQYADTRFAEVLRNPNFFKERNEELRSREATYMKTLEAYGQGRYQEVLSKAQRALANEKMVDFYAKYSFLKALANGQLKGNSILLSGLEEVAKNYPQDPVAKKAQELIAFVQKDELKRTHEDIATYRTQTTEQVADVEEANEELPVVNVVGKYKVEPDAIHYFVLVVGKQVNLNQLRFNLINFNLDYYLQEDYNIADKQLNEYSQLLIVKKFESLEVAKDYYYTFDARQEAIVQDQAPDGYQYFVISVGNYVTLMAERSVSDYIQFFNQSNENNKEQ